MRFFLFPFLWLYHNSINRFIVFPLQKRRLLSQAESYLQQHEIRLKQWQKAHGGVNNLPIVLVNGNWQWLNRAERRRLK
jgi:hypothetical protein